MQEDKRASSAKKGLEQPENLDTETVMKNIKSPTLRIKEIWLRMASDRRGVTAVIFALAFIPMVLAVGVSVDLGKGYLVRERLASTSDAAGLAIGSAIDTGQDLQILLDNFFAANFPSAKLGTVVSSTYDITNDVVTITASASVPTSFMKLIGKNSMDVQAVSVITRDTSGLELVLVLDNTGSMNSGGKLASLKTASHDLINILFGNETAPPLLKLGLVPFAGTVNIGAANTSLVSNLGSYDWGTTSWGGCVMAETYPTDVQDSFTGPWTPFYWPDHNWYNNWIVSGGYNITSSKGPNKKCPQEVTPLTNQRSTLEADIDSMVATGYTHINYGTVWGWRLISPEAPFTEGTSYTDPDWKKAIIILTDGANTTSNSNYTAYQYRSDGILGSTSSSGTTAELNNRLAEVCTNMKAQGIIVYTITFQVSNTTTQNLFANCATSTDNYFNSPSNAELQSAFRSIAAQLKQLHLSQ